MNDATLRLHFLRAVHHFTLGPGVELMEVKTTDPDALANYRSGRKISGGFVAPVFLLPELAARTGKAVGSCPDFKFRDELVQRSAVRIDERPLLRYPIPYHHGRPCGFSFRLSNGEAARVRIIGDWAFYVVDSVSSPYRKGKRGHTLVGGIEGFSSEKGRVRWGWRLSAPHVGYALGPTAFQVLDDARGTGSNQKNCPPVHPATLAKAILFEEPDISPTELANRVGVARSTLYSNRRGWTDVAKTLRARNEFGVNRGTKSRDGEIEAEADKREFHPTDDR